MAMLEYNEATVHKYIIHDGEPFEVIDSHVFRKQQRKPVNAVKIKSLINGRVTEVSYHTTDKVEEAEIDYKDVKFLYLNKGEYWFCEVNDPSKRFQLAADMIGPGGRFLKANSVIEAMVFDEKIIGVKLPIKVELKVKEAPDAVRGNTSSGANKIAILENGTTVNVPLFIKEGETIRVNTETGDYVERANN
ncbi:MAG: hypothetical protein PHV42_01950 [Candidatus Pacebacteria bacterium]|nr:hypothetical protein [Candidatus Paceibacterota bacterium]